MIEAMLRELEGGTVPDKDAESALGKWERHYLQLHRQRYKMNLHSVNQFAIGQHILEVGSVPCHFTALLAAGGYDVTGVDPQPERAQSLLERYSLDVVKCDVEIEPLPFANASFRTVLLNEVIEHMYVDPLHALREITRVLAPGGVLLLFTDNLYSLHTMKSFLLGNSINDAMREWIKLDTLGHRGHIRLYSSKEIRRLLSFVGLVPTHQRYYQYNESIRSRLIYFCAPRCFYPHQLIVARRPEHESEHA